MLSTTDFLTYSRWVGIGTLTMAGIAVIAFGFKWGIRFRLVGVTGFMGVLTAGLFALSLVPLTHTQIPGAAKFSLVYDNGATQAVITVPPDLTTEGLTATLQQAAADLFSPGRLGLGRDQLIIIARTVIHPQPGVSQPLVLGQVTRSLTSRSDDDMVIQINAPNLQKAQASVS
ncbi:Ycf51 family protein [Candidatus Synechococcus calcipolaris G9]|uniref:Ycf51 family protein n=1 Tax=Candidatus Synechococcus calcipolaris G9 TaxID=1497997 RepID=A0ABT6F0E6_9SYNE|nr:Ycf51 family protein [Candidatus Synechococcus calcipolaris]MDG2991339.1 Ycf51 family protein [Candidatus Synechococcus calcipolaris G9]